jgi:methylated-DNA-protein-cysteine methyltransferase related protein
MIAVTRGIRTMRRPDKGLGLTASRLLQSWATGDRRKLPMPPKRKLPQPADAQGDQAVEAICAVIRRIPKGWVATYGQVAAMAGMPRRARLVGRVLQRLDPAIKIPWHRVVNAKGEVSYSLSRNGGDILQRRLLEKEGIRFDDNNRLDLERCRWRD